MGLGRMRSGPRPHRGAYQAIAQVAELFPESLVLPGWASCSLRCQTWCRCGRCAGLVRCRPPCGRRRLLSGGRERGHADNERACVVGKTSKKTTVTWTPDPAEHDYPAAESFLRLIAAPALVKKCTALLSEAPTVHQHAKDILRAAALPLLAVDDPEVARDLKAVAKGTALSPILLIGGDISTGRVLQIADGYHRVCASYHLNEDTEIPCRLVTLSGIAV